MPQIQTPLTQVLNPVRSTGTPTGGIFDAFSRGQQSKQTRLDSIARRDINERQQQQKELQQKVVNLRGTATTVNDLIAQGGDVGGNIRSFLETKIRTNAQLGFDSDDSQAALQALESGGVEEVQKLAGETLQATQGFADAKVGPSDFQKGASFRVKLPDGREAIATNVVNKRTGKQSVEVNDLGGDFVSTLGETGVEETERKVGEAGSKAQIIEKEKRLSTFKQVGLDAADSVANLKRSIELLDNIETGGIDLAIQRGKQFFGVESGNEAELSANLGKNILAQLRPIFGAQFTEREGKRLERIEADFGKSTAGNKRLLKATLALAKRAARRGLKAAEDSEDEFIIDEINRALETTLDFGDETQQAAPAQAAPAGLTSEEEAELAALEAEFGGQ